jgi:hypothetical protein
MAAPLEDVSRFLDAVAYREGHPRPPGGREAHPFVTISRQTGAGGHTLAHVLLQEMAQEGAPLFRGWQVFDRELCEKLLEDPTLRVSMQSLLTEEYRTEVEDAIFSLLGGETPRDVVVKKVFETIRTLATLGRAIIVGRAGMCVTRGLPDGVHLRLVASEATRVKRMMGLLHAGEPEARAAVEKQDRDRARLIRDHCSRDIRDPLLYDAIWNTETVAFKVIAASVIALIKQRAHASGAHGAEIPAAGRRPEAS